MEILRRTVSVLLTLVMIFTMLPVSARATETEPIITEITVETELVDVGDGVLDVPLADETEPAETVPETTAPEIFVEETAKAMVSDVPTSGTCGENLTWALVDGVLTISGEGPMYNNNRQLGYRTYSSIINAITTVMVTDGVTSIAPGAFSGCTNLSSVFFHDSIISVGSRAFYNCNNLVCVELPEGVTHIGEETFYNCTCLESVKLPDSLITIGESAFENCSSLESIAIPAGVAVITNSMFRKCSSLTNVELPEGITSIGENVFDNCTGLVNIVIPVGITTIHKNTFHNCTNLTSIELPESIMSIGERAFYNCTSLTSIVLPEKMTSIGKYAFYNCTSLASIVIPEGVAAIYEYTFYNCSGLLNVLLPESVIAIDVCSFEGCSGLTNIVLPESITHIGNAVFKGCTGLISITIPNSVTTIPYRAFWDCSSLTSIILPEGVTSIGGEAFWHCTNLTSINFPDGIKEIGAWAFNECVSLEKINLPDSIISIGNTAFRKCTSLTSIKLPDGIYSIENSLFIDCTGLKNIVIPNNTISIGDNSFAGCTNLANVTILSYCSIGYSAFSGCSSLISIDIPKGIYSIGGSAFSRCTNLKSIVLSDGLTSIGSFAFDRCTSLISITIPESVTLIEYYTFSECTNLISITIPSSIESIDSMAFVNCDNLQDVYYGGTQQQWENLSKGVRIPKETTIHYNCDNTDTGGEEVPPEETEPEQTNVVREYLNSSDIKINGSGSAVAYYLGAANQVYQLTVDGEVRTVTATEKGVLRVPLGTFQAVGTEAVTVEITHVGDEALAVPQIFQHTVQVTPLAFSQSWKGSMDASVGAKLIAGAKVPVVNLEASLGEVGGKAGVGAAMNISRSYSAGGETLTITSDKKIEAGGTVKCGITGEVLSAEFNSGASLGIGCSDTITYGLKLNNYSTANKGQQRALATYLLGEALTMKPANTWYIPFYKYLAEIVYDDSGCGVIQGSASKMSGSFGAGVSQVSINGVDIANVLNGKVEATFIQSSNAFSDGTQEKSMSGKLSASLSTVTPAKKVEGSEIGANSSLLRADFLGTDVKISVERYKEERKLESTSLSSLYTQVKFLEIGVPSTAVYNKYIFKDKALDGLLSSTSHFDDYINHNLVVLSLSDLCELADVLSESDVPIEYREETKEKYAVSLPLEFDIGLGAGASFGITLSYLEDTGYTSATGYAVNDEILLTSESDDLSSQIRKNKRELGEIFVNCIQTLAEDAANFFQSIGNAIQEGVESTWSWIEGKAESMANWIISITSAPSENDGPWKESSKVGVKGAQVNFSLARQVTDPSEAYATRSAMTIGRPFVVNVTDNATGETIGNFEEEPLEFTIRYAGEDLMAANYDAETQVISMYRYSDDGDYFEYIGGIHDAEAKTVTAAITKPGQYILAAEVIEEEGCGYELGDVNHDTKINAKDATLILQKSVGVLKPTAKFCEDCAEVSGDGKLNAKDSTLILQYSVGLRDSFPAGK